MMRFRTMLLALLTLCVVAGTLCCAPPKTGDGKAGNDNSDPGTGETQDSDEDPQTPDEPDPSPAPESPTALSVDNWSVAYDGFGSVTFGDGIVKLSPKAATAPEETHAALLLLKSTEANPVRNFQLSIVATTDTQLRTPAPNPWEVFWVFFNYLPGANATKTTNYLILKPNGIELGKAFGEIGQTFLYTAGAPTLSIGTPVTYFLEMKDGTLSVSINNAPAFTFSQHPVSGEKLYDQAGSIGLYTEDAGVTVSDVRLIIN